MANFSVDFSGFNDILKKYNSIGENIKPACTSAMRACKREVNVSVGNAMKKHNRTFNVIKSLDSEKEVTWYGDKGEINIGFDLGNGGFPSIFLMYGTPFFGKDQELYDAIYGGKVKARLKKLQEDFFHEQLIKLGVAYK